MLTIVIRLHDPGGVMNDERAYRYHLAVRSIMGQRFDSLRAAVSKLRAIANGSQLEETLTWCIWQPDNEIRKMCKGLRDSEKRSLLGARDRAIFDALIDMSGYSANSRMPSRLKERLLALNRQINMPR